MLTGRTAGILWKYCRKFYKIRFRMALYSRTNNNNNNNIGIIFGGRLEFPSIHCATNVDKDTLSAV